MATPREEIQARNGEPIQFAPPDPANGSKKSDKRTRKRLTVYLNEDGSPDLDALDDDSKSKLGLGATAPAPESTEEPKEPVSPETAGMLIGLLASVESTLIAAKLNLPQAQVMQTLSPPEKIGMAMNERAARVLTKYSGSLGRWEDELMLGAILIQWQLAAFSQLRQIVAMRAEAESKRAADARAPEQKPRPAESPSQES